MPWTKETSLIGPRGPQGPQGPPGTTVANVAWVESTAEADALPAGTLAIILEPLPAGPVLVHSQQIATGSQFGSADIAVLNLTKTPRQGNLLVTSWAVDKNQFTNPVGAPDNWTKLDQVANAGITLVTAYKIASGTETSIRWAPEITGATPLTRYNAVGYAELGLRSPAVATSRYAQASAGNVTSMSADLGTLTGSGIAVASIAVDTSDTAWNGVPPTWSAPWQSAVTFTDVPDGTSEGWVGLSIAVREFNNQAVSVTATAAGTADEHALAVYAYTGVRR